MKKISFSVLIILILTIIINGCTTSEKNMQANSPPQHVTIVIPDSTPSPEKVSDEIASTDALDQALEELDIIE